MGVRKVERMEWSNGVTYRCLLLSQFSFPEHEIPSRGRCSGASGIGVEAQSRTYETGSKLFMNR